jgi:2-oxoglutarate/2-oxoacid ferredoxin oxidoreductase subunit alpha
MPAWGDGYAANVVGLVHLPDGNIGKYSPEMHMECVSRIYNKIEDHIDEIAQVEGNFLEGCRHLVVAYGTTVRAAYEAVQELRGKGMKDVGFLRLKTIWPFAENKIRSMVGPLENVFFPEMNLGYLIHPLKEVLRDRAKRFIPIPCLGQLHTPDQIIEKVEEVIGEK